MTLSFRYQVLCFILKIHWGLRTERHHVVIINLTFLDLHTNILIVYYDVPSAQKYIISWYKGIYLTNIYLFLYTHHPCANRNTCLKNKDYKIISNKQVRYSFLSGVHINSYLVHLISDVFNVFQWINVIFYDNCFTLEGNTRIWKPVIPTSYYKYRHPKTRGFQLQALYLQEVLLSTWSYITITTSKNANIIYIIITLMMGKCLYEGHHWQWLLLHSKYSLFVFVNFLKLQILIFIIYTAFRKEDCFPLYKALLALILSGLHLEDPDAELRKFSFQQ